MGGLRLSSVIPTSANWILTFTCGLTTNGAAYCWGANRNGQLGTDAAGLSTCELAGVPFTCSNVPVPVAGGIDFISLATGREFACGAGRNRRTYCWGENDSGQLGDGTTTDQFTPVAVQFPDRSGGRLARRPHADADLIP